MSTTMTFHSPPLPLYVYLTSTVFTVCALLAAYIWSSRATLIKGFEVALGPKDGVSPSEAEKAYEKRAISILTAGVKKFSGPFQVFTESGSLIVLPSSKYYGEIKSDRRFGVSESNRKVFMTNIPGFDGLHAVTQDKLLREVVRSNLKTGLANLNTVMVEETNNAAETVLGSPSDWKTITVHQPFMEMVARISSRVFLGLPLCRDQRWLRVSVAYTFQAFHGARVLRFWPERLRPLVHWFLPDCRKLRGSVHQARELLKPVLREMRQEWEQRQASGDKTPSTNGIHMMLDMAKKQGYPLDKIDFIGNQLGLSTAAVHSTSDMVMQSLFDLCGNPEYFAPMRREIDALMAANGGVLDNNTKLNNLRFMDSFMREVQRMKPTTVTSSKRVTSEDVTLSDGTFLPKGSFLTLYDNARIDSTFYPEPERFDPYRFLRAREEPGKENMLQYVSTGPEYPGFGHGLHACTGRFFANTEIKLILCHLLTHYDWKFPEGAGKPEPLIVGAELIANPTAQLMYRKRVTD